MPTNPTHPDDQLVTAPLSVVVAVFLDGMATGAASMLASVHAPLSDTQRDELARRMARATTQSREAMVDVVRTVRERLAEGHDVVQRPTIHHTVTDWGQDVLS